MINQTLSVLKYFRISQLFLQLRILIILLIIFMEITNMWTKPEYTEMRFGFEVTMYIANR